MRSAPRGGRPGERAGGTPWFRTSPDEAAYEQSAAARSQAIPNSCQGHTPPQTFSLGEPTMPQATPAPLAEMPELGSLDPRHAAALAELAPYTAQSGSSRGSARAAGGAWCGGACT
jgi:hypothetical protein